MAQAITLSAPDPQLPFTIFADASGIGAGCALAQLQPGEDAYKFLHMASTKFTQVQRRWDTTDREV